MRGDLRLDFVAKTLALAGLGLVGALGALVDYWPGPARLPGVASINVARPTPLVRTLVDLKGLDPWAPQTAESSVAAVVRATRPTVGGGPGPTVARAFTEEWVDDGRVAARLPVQDVAFPAALPPARLMADAEGASDQASAGAFDDGGERPSMTLANWRPLMPVAVDRSDDGFFSGMLKKTGSSVSSSLGKASNSVVGAVRAVGGAVRKAF